MGRRGKHLPGERRLNEATGASDRNG
jgi:hypothetical protein